jgi:hypothetical protein
MRKLSPHERSIVDRLLEEHFPGRDQVRAQIDDCLVEPIDENGSLRFLVGRSAKAPVRRRVPVEGYIEDEDDVPIHVLLHVVKGEVEELEIFKGDSSRVLAKVDASRLRVLRRD